MTGREKLITFPPKLQALVYDILPSTAAVFSYATGSRKLSANEQNFVGARTVVSLLQSTERKQGVFYSRQQSLHQLVLRAKNAPILQLLHHAADFVRDASRPGEINNHNPLVPVSVRDIRFFVVAQTRPIVPFTQKVVGKKGLTGTAATILMPHDIAIPGRRLQLHEQLFLSTTKHNTFVRNQHSIASNLMLNSIHGRLHEPLVFRVGNDVILMDEVLLSVLRCQLTY